ncbi:MAG: ribosome maturation factor RimP [Pseudomonadota bacterium]
MDLERTRPELEQKFVNLFGEAIKAQGLKLYDLEYHPGQKLIRVYIMDRATGSAGIDDCAKIDHALTPFFDTESWIPEGLTLEVSSPGLDRPLRARDHFLRAVNKQILLQLSSALSDLIPAEEWGDLPRSLKGTRKIKGRLVGLEGEQLKLDYKGHVLRFTMEKVAKANLQDY